MGGLKDEEGIYDRLKSYSESGYYPFHMPGHKRIFGGMVDPYRLDITEIDGFDDLNHPEEDGLITKAQERAAKLYRSEETHFLVNGSTAGILSALIGSVRPGGTLLMARNCHRSVYNAVELSGITPVYISPHAINGIGVNGAVSPDALEDALQENDAVQAAVITSPTYDGVCSDVRRMAGICHRHGIPLIVDQAHGAHLAFSDYFPEDALSAGADVVIHSLHKTLPSLTQTGLLHIRGKYADRERIRKYLSVFQTSSPSYVLMASIDSCISLLERQKEELFAAYTERLNAFRESLGGLKLLKLEGGERDRGFYSAEGGSFDKSRLLISTAGCAFTGRELYGKLADVYRIQLEAAAPDYVIGISSVCDSEEGFNRLSEALCDIDREAEPAGTDSDGDLISSYPGIPERALCARDAADRAHDAVYVSLDEAGGRIAAEYIYLYPPGIPLAVPGEILNDEIVNAAVNSAAGGFEVHGIHRCAGNEIRVKVLD